MKAKQWIGIEEAAKKYQVSSKRINTWCKNQEITYTKIDHYPLLDENSLQECIERNTQLCLAQKEFEQRKEKLIKENEEELFILQSLKELTPTIRIIIKELAGMIRDENRRRMFLFIMLEGNIKKYSAESCQDFYSIQREFQILVREIQSRIGFLKNYKHEITYTKALLRLYEMKFGKNLFNREVILQESPESQERKEALELLDTCIKDFGFDCRAERILTQGGIETLRDLLKLTYKYGWKRLVKLREFGPTTQKKVIDRLQLMNILDEEEGCYLYKYLDE
ncbi:hypothetical protein RJT01_07505 [Bacteroides ovatus]|uniref:hypothetical protein n=1 Tax=Bacteroides ovatus TaxID=28116 RepID=UPI003144E098